MNKNKHQLINYLLDLCWKISGIFSNSFRKYSL